MNQLPFSSINYGTCTLPEGRMVIKALLEGCLKGTGNGETSIFPCGIFKSKKGVNRKPGDPNYDMYKLAIKSTVRRLYPNYANCDWSQQKKWVAKDRAIKENVLAYIKENDTTLLSAIKHLILSDEEIGNNLSLKVENGEVFVDYTESPIEEFSTINLVA